jgi:hypothetical protein
VNAYNSTYGGGEDCFVFKLSADGSTLLYSTFVGGSINDWAASIAVDSSGNAYVTGDTVSPDFPTVNAYNSTYGGGEDCFVFKLSADGSTLLYSIFVGGSDSDVGNSIAVDSYGNAYITGVTGSPDFPTVNAYNSTYGGYGDCFVFKLIISDYTPDFYYIVASRILQLLQYIYQVFLGLVLFTHQVVLGTINLIALGLVLFTPVYLTRMLISRQTTDITGIPPPDHLRLVCQLCNATYLNFVFRFLSKYLSNPEILRCRNCDREFLCESTRAPEESVSISHVHVPVAHMLLSRLRESVPISHVRVPVAYMLLSRLRESRWNIFRRKKESE